MQIRENRCDVAEPSFVRLLEQECSGHAEGEPDLKRMCQPGESCNNQVESQLLLQLLLLLSSHFQLKSQSAVIVG